MTLDTDELEARLTAEMLRLDPKIAKIVWDILLPLPVEAALAFIGELAHGEKFETFWAATDDVNVHPKYGHFRFCDLWDRWIK